MTTVVTDGGIRDEDRQMLETAGVGLIIAEGLAERREEAPSVA